MSKRKTALCPLILTLSSRQEWIVSYALAVFETLDTAVLDEEVSELQLKLRSCRDHWKEPLMFRA